MLWLVIVRGVALSSMTVEDGEAYKDFLKHLIPTFVGPKRPRSSGRWRPFTPEGSSAESQAIASRARDSRLGPRPITYPSTNDRKAGSHVSHPRLRIVD